MKARHPPLRVVQSQEQHYFEENFKLSEIFGFSFLPEGICHLIDATNELTPGKNFGHKSILEGTTEKPWAKTILEG